MLEVLLEDIIWEAIRWYTYKLIFLALIELVILKYDNILVPPTLFISIQFWYPSVCFY